MCSSVHTIEFAVAVDIYEAADQWKDFEITDVAPVQVTAYEDPDNKGTFYSSTEAYKVPQTATAFAVVNKATGKMELISVGRIVAADVPVLIKSTQGKVVLKLTKEAGTKPEKNDLKGTDTAIESAGAGIKAFTLGQNGAGFYIWEGKPIPANKAYLNVQ